MYFVNRESAIVNGSLYFSRISEFAQSEIYCRLSIADCRTTKLTIMKLILHIFWFLLITTTIQPATAQYNIIDYGAKNDTSQLSTQAINKAIAACNSNGGGRVVVPAGNYKSGTIIMKS